MFAVGIFLTQYGERVFMAVSSWYYHRAAMTYSAPPDRVVYESDPSKFASLPSNYRRGMHNTPHVGAPAWPWEGIRGIDFGETVLFLHARTAPGGTPKRVCVFLPSGHFSGWNASRNVHGVRLAIQWDVEGKNDGIPASIDIPGWSRDPADPRYLRFFAGQPDPRDPARFSIPYELDGVGKGMVEGVLQQDDTISLTLHPPPATRPATTPSEQPTTAPR